MVLEAAPGDAPTHNITGVRADLTLKDGVDKDTFDFDLHVDKEYFGIETDKLQLKGIGKYNEVEDFTFSCPVNLFRVKYVME